MGLNKKVVISIFIAAIMILSTLGFVLNYSVSSETLRYGDFKFVRTPQGLRTKIDSTYYYFNFFPTQVEDIQLSEEAKQSLKDLNAVSVTYNPKSNFSATLAEVQFYLEETLAGPAQIFVIKGLTNNTGYQLPEISCKNATEKIPAIEFRESNSTRIIFENNCLIAEAYTHQEFLKLTDRILYSILAVMK